MSGPPGGASLLNYSLRHTAPPVLPASELLFIRQIAIAMAAAWSICFMAACGIQGPPRPPRVEQPERISDLSVTQKGQAFNLSFTRPSVASDGERLTKPLEIEIFRAITKQGDKPPETLSRIAPWLTLSAGDLLHYAEGEKILFPARLSDPEFAQSQDSILTFEVRGLTHGFRNRAIEGEPSDIVHATLLDVSGPVENFQIITTEKALILSWTPPSRSVNGHALAPLAGYRIYWSPTGKPATFQMHGETDAATFTDPDFAFEHPYFYKVRAVFKQGNQMAESEDSVVKEILPHDTFPPAIPSNLSALFAGGAVELVWTANTEPDLAGYNIYRRGKMSAWRKLNQDLLRTPTFEDRTVQPGLEYFYKVTSVDLTHNESSPSEEAAIETP